MSGILKRLWRWLIPHHKNEVVGLDRDVAIVALMVEAAHRDGQYQDSEKALVEQAIRSFFPEYRGIPSQLREKAEEAQRQSFTHMHFATITAQHLDAASREGLVAVIWRIIYANRDNDPREVELILSLADVFDIPTAKLMAMGRDENRNAI